MKKLKVTGYAASELDIQKEVFDEIGELDGVYDGDEGADERAVLNAWDGRNLFITRDNLAQMQRYALQVANMYDNEIEENYRFSKPPRDYRLLRNGFYRLHDRLMKLEPYFGLCLSGSLWS